MWHIFILKNKKTGKLKVYQGFAAGKKEAVEKMYKLMREWHIEMYRSVSLIKTIIAGLWAKIRNKDINDKDQ